jgi:hypothetical protein
MYPILSNKMNIDMMDNTRMPKQALYYKPQKKSCLGRNDIDNYQITRLKEKEDSFNFCYSRGVFYM